MAPSSDREASVWALLDTVNDPEIPVISIVELGIARRVSCTGDAVEVVITPTYSGCPAMREIETDVIDTLTAAGYADARVLTELAPAWTTDWISASGRDKLRRYGIAAPLSTATAGDAFPLQPAVRCPRCDSVKTELVSEFGSTACKALFRCRACLEPFDYFKPL